VVAHTSPLIDKYFEHSLIIFGNLDSQFGDLLFYNQPTFLSNRFGFFFGTLKQEIRQLIKDADILLIHGFYLFSTLIALRNSDSKRIFIMPHGSLEPYQEIKSKFRKYIFRKFVLGTLREKSINFVVATESEVEGVRKVFPGNQIDVIGIGVTGTAPSLNSPPFTGSKINLLSLSRIHKKKRIDISIKALSILRDEGVECVLRIAGNGDKKLIRKLRNLVEELNLENEVQFLGHLERIDKENLILQSDILLLPSENENFAIAVAESIAFGKPVIVSSNVAMSDFVEKHKNGIVINSLDETLLATAISTIKTDYYAYQEKCLESANLLYWPKVFEKWVQVLKDERA
jgi:glycosyltransferase involved in cell wall biosynthesis